MPDEGPIRKFAQLVQRDDQEINLAEAALAIARTEYPELDAAAELARLDRLAAALDLSPRAAPLSNIAALNEYLFTQQGFSGNEEDYDDPRNSFLNEVLERRKGIPITLALVYTEVAQRRRLPVVGVGFPGHFLAKYLTGPSTRSERRLADDAAPATPQETEDEDEAILIDPYHRGAILTRADCVARLRSHFGDDAELKPEYLAASTPKSILARMLNNLKGSYFRLRNFPRVLLMIEMALAIDPASADHVRDRGMVYFALKRYREAMADFNAYLSLAPRQDPQVKEVLQAIQRIRAMMN
ncbi:MAG TPA: transglutaminase-like domain-containing protein [Terriglobia bacterium]|nr:transglutaminase-like domain-containing protein [Terriglobia bacterium]